MTKKITFYILVLLSNTLFFCVQIYFGTESEIALVADHINTVYSFDIGHNSDLDVLSASAYDNEIVWCENIDGNGAFVR